VPDHKEWYFWESNFLFLTDAQSSQERARGLRSCASDNIVSAGQQCGEAWPSRGSTVCRLRMNGRRLRGSRDLTSDV
jgi:hypothetical protein